MKLTPIASAARWLGLAFGFGAGDPLAAQRSRGEQNAMRARPRADTRAALRAGVSGRRSYAGAAQGRTTADWVAQSTSADAELYTSLRTLRNRSRQLVRDNEYAQHAVERVIPNNVVGQGVRFQAQVPMRRGTKLNETLNDKIEAEWALWTRAENCHTAGKLAFQAIERMLMRCTPESGEILVRMVTRKFGNSRVPLGLEIIEADQLVDNWSGRTNEGREIRMGVEVDEWQRPVAYWLYPRHPGDYARAATEPSNTWQRVPADEVIHIALWDRPNQTRGIPWLHSVLVKLRHMGGYEEAEIIRARASASIMGFIESEGADTGVPDDVGGSDDPAGSDDVVDGEKVYDMAPGIIKELQPGEKFSGFAPQSANAALEPFMRFMLRAVAAGTGVSYESLSRDYTNATYSSARLALLEDRDLWRVLQAWLIRTFHQRVYEKWLDMAVLAGVLDLPSYEANPELYQAVRWSPRGWDWVDPVKEVAAYRAAVRAGFMTVDDVIAAKGGDVEDTFKRAKRDRDLAKQYGLVLDTDPSQTNDKGALQVLASTGSGKPGGEGGAGGEGPPGNGEPDGDEEAEQ